MCQKDFRRPQRLLRILTGSLGDAHDSMLTSGVLPDLSQNLSAGSCFVCESGNQQRDTYTILETAMNEETEAKLTIDPRLVPRVGSVRLACRGS